MATVAREPPPDGLEADVDLFGRRLGQRWPAALAPQRRVDVAVRRPRHPRVLGDERVELAAPPLQQPVEGDGVALGALRPRLLADGAVVARHLLALPVAQQRHHDGDDAAGAGRALNGPEFAGAKDLAAYKAKVRAAWPSVKVEHVEPSGVSDSPQIGDTLEVKAYVDLGGLEPDEVEVQLVHGHVTDTDEIWGTEVAPIQLVESADGGRHQFAGSQTLRRTGSFGYSVRIVPRHRSLATAAELGLARNA